MLRNQFEKSKEHYCHLNADTKDIILEFESIMKNLLTFYDSETTHLLFDCSCDAFKVYVIVFQWDGAKC